MANTYTDLQTIADELNAGTLYSGADLRVVLRYTEEVSRRIDNYCRRHFYAFVATKQTGLPQYKPQPLLNMGEIVRLSMPLQNPFYELPDVAAATEVDYDANGDLSFSQVLNLNTDFNLRQSGPPLLPESQAWIDPPYDRLDLYFPVDAITTPYLPRGRRCQISGTFGYTTTAMLQPVACTVTLADATTASMSSSAAADLSIGQTLLAGTEQLYISAGAGTAWTVQRAVNGTTGAAHAAVTPQRYSYPSNVVDACLDTVRAQLFSRLRDPAIASESIDDIRLTYRPTMLEESGLTERAQGKLRDYRRQVA